MGQLERIVDAHAAARQQLEDRIERLVVAEFDQFNGWYSPRQVRSIVRAVADKMAAGQVGMAQVAEGYLERVVAYTTARTVVGAAVPTVMGQTLRHGVTDHEEVYTRVAAEYRVARAAGAADADALAQALTRARAMVSTDLGLAYQRQSWRFVQSNRITFYRRVIRPEMSRKGSCGLCVAASDRRYKSSLLLPIHAKCKCAVIPITANTDPGSQLNADTLRDLYGEAGSTNPAALKRTRVTVFDHPELGPQLRVAGQHQQVLTDAA